MNFYKILQDEDSLHHVLGFFGVELLDIAALHRALLLVSKEMSNILLRYIQCTPLKLISVASESITHRREVIAWACQKRVTLTEIDLRLFRLMDVNIFHYLLKSCDVSLLQRLVLDFRVPNEETKRDIKEIEEVMATQQGYPLEVHQIPATKTTKTEFLVDFWDRLSDGLAQSTVGFISAHTAFDDKFMKFCMTSPHAQTIEELTLDLPDRISFDDFTNMIGKLERLKALEVKGLKWEEHNEGAHNTLKSKSLENLRLEGSKLHLAEINCPQLKILCGRNTNGVRPFPQYTPWPEEWYGNNPPFEDPDSYVPDCEIHQTESLPMRHIIIDASSCPHPKMTVSDSCQVVFVGRLEYEEERMRRHDPNYFSDESSNNFSIGDDRSDDLDMYPAEYPSDYESVISDSDFSMSSWESDSMLQGS